MTEDETKAELGVPFVMMMGGPEFVPSQIVRDLPKKGQYFALWVEPNIKTNLMFIDEKGFLRCRA